MIRGTPKKLGIVPIVDATFELRFEPSDLSANELMLGLMHRELKDQIPKVSALPQATIPREMIQSIAALQYQPQRSLSGDQYHLALGPKVLALACIRPYSGWAAFSEMIRRTVDSLRNTDQVKEVERFSLKYRNIIEALPEVNQLGMLNVHLDVSSLPFGAKSTHIKVETAREQFDNLITIQTHTEVAINTTDERLRGILVDVDTIYQRELQNFWSDANHLLEKAHEVEKYLFFNILKPGTLESLNPEWE